MPGVFHRGCPGVERAAAGCEEWVPVAGIPAAGIHDVHRGGAMAFDAVGAMHWEDAGLAAETAALARRFAAATGLALGHVGAEPAGTVHVTGDGTGRVDGVTVDPGWRATVDGDGLGAGVGGGGGGALGRRLGGRGV